MADQKTPPDDVLLVGGRPADPPTRERRVELSEQEAELVKAALTDAIAYRQRDALNVRPAYEDLHAQIVARLGR
jgi:hypothetical protein